MALLEQEKYRIKELADEWRVSEGLVEEYLETGKLTASVMLTQSIDCLCWSVEGVIYDDINNIDEDWLEFHKANEAEDLLCGEIDTEAQDMIYETDPDGLISKYSELYHINNFDVLEWDSKSECDLKGCSVRLASDNSPNCFYVLEKSKIISKDSIRITKQSIKRFLMDYCGDDATLPAKLSVHWLRRKRWSGGGIPYLKLSDHGAVRYRREHVDEFMQSRVRKSTSDSGALS